MRWMLLVFGKVEIMSKLTITMSSDWHVGSGTGRPGSIDQLVQRDQRGLPYIPAKTLTGILRDSCELVAHGLDDEQSTGIWHQYVEYLFGNQPAIAQGVVEEAPIAAALSLRSAYLPQTLITALSGKPDAVSALVFVKPGVAIDPASGTAKTDFLRFEEMVRSGSYLEAEYELNLDGLDPTQSQSLQALLVAGAAMVERLGAKRRRGAGKCELNIHKLDLAKSLQYLEAEPPALNLTHPTIELPVSDNPNSSNWYTIDLHLETISPLIIHARTLGNLVSSLDYIPGAAFLPIISKQLRDKIDLRQAIANNQIVISNATLEVNGQKGQAMPFALFQEKQNKQKIYNRLGEPESKPGEEDKPQLKGMRSGYIANNRTANISMGASHFLFDRER
jgi:CRISPR-associated protein Csx10